MNEKINSENYFIIKTYTFEYYVKFSFWVSVNWILTFWRKVTDMQRNNIYVNIHHFESSATTTYFQYIHLMYMYASDQFMFIGSELHFNKMIWSAKGWNTYFIVDTR